MALHLITGYAGKEHITSADQGAYNAATFGDGQFVLSRGAQFKTTLLTNNNISIADGEAMMKGRYIKMAQGTSESVNIEDGTVGTKRKDLIVIRYERNTSDNTETTEFRVIKGEETTGTPVDPEYIDGNITDGVDSINEMPLYSVLIDGINVTTITPLFVIKTSMVDYMDNYQLPPAKRDGLGGLKADRNYWLNDVTEDGKPKIACANFSISFKANTTIFQGKNTITLDQLDATDVVKERIKNSVMVGCVLEIQNKAYCIAVCNNMFHRIEIYNFSSEMITATSANGVQISCLANPT